MRFTDITEKFGVTDIISVNEMKTGHTNRTYLIECEAGKYILQSLNRDIFKNPEIVMNNISIIEQAFADEKNIAIPYYLSCNDRNYMEQNSEIWRMCRYIEKSSNAENINYSYGYTVGRFLHVVNAGGFEFETPINLHNFGLNLPVRNIHGDTKLDNIIFGDKTAIIDFDTAMRGYICADYGDMIRSVTTKSFNLSTIYEVTHGFANGIGKILTDNEIKTLYFGIILIINELLYRYQDGNRNFPNKTPEQCIEREKQLTIQLDRINRHEDDIINIINECFE